MGKLKALLLVRRSTLLTEGEENADINEQEHSSAWRTPDSISEDWAGDYLTHKMHKTGKVYLGI